MVDIKGRFEDDLVKLKQKHDDMREEMRTFKDIEGRKRELTDQKRDSEERQKSLQSVLNVTVSAVDDAKRRLAQFEVSVRLILPNTNIVILEYFGKK